MSRIDFCGHRDISTFGYAASRSRSFDRSLIAHRVARSLGLLRSAIGGHRVQPARLRTRRVWLNGAF